MDSAAPSPDLYDVAIVGGGPAGLSAALQLGRAGRRVVVLDAGVGRNARAEHMHGYLTRDGMSPADFRRAAREEVEGYGARVLETSVGSVERDQDFRLQTPDGSLRARALVLATGLVDTLPDIEGLAELWGTRVFHCVYCHGAEVADARVGVLGSNPTASLEALLVRQWSPHTSLLLHTAPAPNLSTAAQLESRGIDVVEGLVTRVDADGEVLRVVLDSGDEVTLDALVVAPVTSAANALTEQLAVELEPDDVAGNHVLVDEVGHTSVPGVYAAGNLALPAALVIDAVAHGSRVATAINFELMELDVDKALAAATE